MASVAALAGFRKHVEDLDAMYPTRARGRTPTRDSDSQSGDLSPSSSRASSMSSVRSVIDERMEWAHQERMRSASRKPPPLRPPFCEHSPFYAEYMENSISSVDRMPLDAFEVYPGRYYTSAPSPAPEFPIDDLPASKTA